MSALEKLLNSSKNEHAAILSESDFFEKRSPVRTKAATLNIALSGDMAGGLTSGLTVLAGPSKHFKSNIGLTAISAYMKKYKEAVCIFYDSEGGVTKAYLNSMGVDPSRIMHVPIKNIEQLKFEMMNQLEALERGDDVIIFVDSIGNLASKKEAEDAKDNKSAADMTRAKEIKSLFRVITPYFQHLDIPGIMIAHTYDTMEMFSKKVVGGGQGVMLSADTVLIIGRQQDKDQKTKEIKGWDFILNIEKSRFVKEKMNVPLVVKYDKGIDIFGGLLNIATDLGFVERPTTQSYNRVFVDEETGERTVEERKWKKKEINGKEFWSDLVKHKPFRDAIKSHYQLGEEAVDEQDKDDIDDIIGE